MAVLVAAGLVAAVVGAGAGYLAQGRVDDEVTVTDSTGQLSVVVPAGWSRAESTAEWTPPVESDARPGGSGEADTQAALSVGTSTTWTTDGQGVFVGLLPGTQLPTRVPQHPECDRAGSPVRDDGDGDSGRESLTVVFTGCPDGVVVERVVQVAGNLLLWVQVRSTERGTATAVLAHVVTEV